MVLNKPSFRELLVAWIAAFASKLATGFVAYLSKLYKFCSLLKFRGS